MAQSCNPTPYLPERLITSNSTVEFASHDRRERTRVEMGDLMRNRFHRLPRDSDVNDSVPEALEWEDESRGVGKAEQIITRGC